MEKRVSGEVMGGRKVLNLRRIFKAQLIEHIHQSNLHDGLEREKRIERTQASFQTCAMIDLALDKNQFSCKCLILY